MNSGKVLGGSFGLIDSTNWFETRLEIGVRSFSGSIAMLEYTWGLITIRLSAPRRSVCPSGAARATSVAAALPFAAGLLSITTGWARLCEIFSPTTRATRSGAPPGGMVTRIWIGREGNCACAAREKPSAASAVTNLIALRCSARGLGAVALLQPPRALHDELGASERARIAGGDALGQLALEPRFEVEAALDRVLEAAGQRVCDPNFDHLFPPLGNAGRRDWTRTNDPYHVKVV